MIIAVVLIMCMTFKLKLCGRFGSFFLKKYIMPKLLNKKRVPTSGTLFYNLLIYNIVYFCLNSTRRFCERPASVAFEATGRLSPKPVAEILLAEIPELTK